MKKSTVMAVVASVMLLTAPQNADAQLLKKLGKAIGEAAKETWENSKNASTQGTTTSYRLSTAGNEKVSNPNLTVELVSCVRSGNEVMVNYNVKNNHLEDRNFNLLDCDVLDLENYTKAYDEKGKRHLIDFIYNDRRIRSNIDCMVGINIPHGIKVPLVMVVKFVDPSITKMARLQLAFNHYKFTAENVPIEEPEAKEKAIASETPKQEDNNLSVLGISLGQTKAAILRDFAAKGFKSISEYDIRGSFYNQQSRLSIDEYDGKVIVELYDTKSYTSAQARQRVAQLKQTLQGTGTVKHLTGAGDFLEGYRIMQKGGKIEIYAFNEDEEEANSNYWKVITKYSNQDFNDEF